ncbi:SgcJ/EcaC family oxidoreductase [Streptomyces luteogriseus]|uniref:SgcJ/EcaC family oxidoreductase n=1 Tax=Streptomyces luteogriseus TaxID=68233 RepID=UPI00382B2EEF
MHETDGTREDTGQIRALWAEMARGWAAGDGALFAANFTPDCDFTTVSGDKPAGRDGIEAGHAALFDGPYAGTVLDARVVAVRFLGPGLATVEAESTVSAPDGKPPHHHARTGRRGTDPGAPLADPGVPQHDPRAPHGPADPRGGE